jgi:hypothetical protein
MDPDGVDARLTCPACGIRFHPMHRRQRTCGARVCQYRLAESRRRLQPGWRNRVWRMRARCESWATEHRNVTARNDWLAGAPPSGSYLPGGIVQLAVSPPPQWPVVHRNIRAVHGMISALTGGHTGRNPRFSLLPFPSPFGWAVYLNSDEGAMRFAVKRLDGELYGRSVVITTGSLIRLKSPTVARRGHVRLRLDAITPVCVRSGLTICTAPTAHSLVSALTVEFPERLGLLREDAARIKLDVIERATESSAVPLGGKYGLVRGWIGHCIVETNAVGHWLLLCAERIGLGARTAFGFGRVRVGITTAPRRASREST